MIDENQIDEPAEQVSLAEGGELDDNSDFIDLYIDASGVVMSIPVPGEGLKQVAIPHGPALRRTMIASLATIPRPLDPNIVMAMLVVMGE